MSQTVTYKTDFKDKADIWSAINDLVSNGVFGPAAKLNTRNPDNKNEPFDTGVYHHGNPSRKQNIIMRVTGGDEEHFGEGFYSGGGNGFAIEEDPKTGKFELLFDLNYQSEITPKIQEKINKVKQKITDMVKVHENKAEIQRVFGDKIHVTVEGELEVEMEMELTVEELAAALGRKI